MGQKILVNKYTPTCEEPNLPWYERDGLLTYIDQLKCKEFIMIQIIIFLMLKL